MESVDVLVNCCECPHDVVVGDLIITINSMTVIDNVLWCDLAASDGRLLDNPFGFVNPPSVAIVDGERVDDSVLVLERIVIDVLAV